MVLNGGRKSTSKCCQRCALLLLRLLLWLLSSPLSPRSLRQMRSVWMEQTHARIVNILHLNKNKKGLGGEGAVVMVRATVRLLGCVLLAGNCSLMVHLLLSWAAFWLPQKRDTCERLVAAAHRPRWDVNTVGTLFPIHIEKLGRMLSFLRGRQSSNLIASSSSHYYYFGGRRRECATKKKARLSQSFLCHLLRTFLHSQARTRRSASCQAFLHERESVAASSSSSPLPPLSFFFFFF